MVRLQIILLSTLMMFTIDLRSQSSHDDFLPLSIGNRWTFQYSGYHHDDLEDVWLNDTGLAIDSIIAKVASSDSIIWQFLETRQLVRHYQYWNYVDTTYSVTETSSFYIVEYLAANHQLSSSRDFSTVLDIALLSNYSDSTSTYRYYPQQSNDTIAHSHIDYQSPDSYDSLFVSLERLRGPIILRHSYSFPGAQGRYQLNLMDVHVTSVQAYEPLESPSDFNLQNNFPNPFNPSTTIPFSVDKATRATLRVYDVLGRCIRTISDGPVQPGHYFAFWHAVQQSSGTYFCIMQANGASKAIKITLLK